MKKEILKKGSLLSLGLLSFNLLKAADYPLKIINNTNVIDDTYITVVDGANIYTVNNDGSLTKGPLLGKAYLQDYSKSIGTTGDFTIKLPDPFVSGRIYVSIGHPLGGVASSIPFYSTNSSDSNYYMSQVVYDKFELTWQSGVLYIDPTSVDFFGIPITIQNPSPIVVSDLTESGYPLGMSWSQIMNKAVPEMPTGVYSENQTTWSSLVFNDSGSNPIRIISPSGIATSPGATNSLGSQKNIANDPPATGTSYLLQTISSTSYLNNLISYYTDTSNQLAFDVSQLNQPAYPQTIIFKDVVYFANGISANSQCSQKINGYDSQGRPIYGAYANSSDCWEFIPKVCADTTDLSTCTTPTGNQSILQKEYIPMDYVSSFDFFSPGQWPFDNNNILPKVYTTVATIQTNHPAKGLIAESLTALFSAGLLPVSNSQIYNIAIDKDSLKNIINSNEDILYKNNSANGSLTDKGPWFSQYSKVIHSLCYDKASGDLCTNATAPSDKQYPTVYTFAFDDFLAQDGTLTSNNISNPITVTINDMSGYPQTTPGTPPRPNISVDTPTVVSGTLLNCQDERPSQTCSIAAVFTTKNTPEEILGSYIVQASPITSTANGSNCHRIGQSSWAQCGGIAPTNINTISVTKVSGPDSSANYTYKVTSEVPRDQIEQVVTGAVWKNCPNSTTQNKFKYYVSVSDGTTTIAAESPNTSIYHNIPGCAVPN
ncbi:beta-1,3-glucanase family protein [Allofrancisella frigidaquae]|uniref:GH64 domain-containing protein n=1 Tax=Allofrancisella frigidaquae TaxID=1085644 RepID=A0A6M3HU64_9GAMM|nr:beta-1,3-glucanase family protein [Allofrancisella frigidaquae]QIV94580.1 hypothetical protein E3E15_04085 [Allofrancisella frigidaquae]